MKYFTSRLAIAIVAFASLPFAAFAGAIVNNDNGYQGYGRQSMCKPFAEIVKNTDSFTDKQSVSMSGGDFFEANGTVGYVSVQAIAANTGDANKTVNMSIMNSSGTNFQTSHTFNVSVDGSSKNVTLNSSSPTKVQHISSYKILRISKDDLDDDQVIGTTTVQSINLPHPGNNNFAQYFDCTDYGTFIYPTFPINATPANWGFEQGFINVYRVTKQSGGTATNCDITFNSNPNLLNPGASTVLNWTSNTGTSGCTAATSCLATNGWNSGSLNASGVYTYTTSSGASPGSTQNFNISCTYPDNTTKNATTSITFQGNTGPTNYCEPTLDASPNLVFPGSSVNINWSATGNSNNCIAANYCLAQSDWAAGSLSNQGNRSYVTQSNAQGSQTFAVKCYYSDGSVRQASDYITFQGNNQTYGPPTIDASPSAVYPGNQVSIVWSGGYGATSCYAVDGWANGTLSQSGSRLYTTSVGNSLGSQTFQVRCSYPDGSQRDATDYITFLQHNVPPVVVPPNDYVNPGNSGTNGIAGSPIVRTLAARSIEKTSAKLRGYFNANGCPAITTWFEYGRDKSNLDLRSDSITQANKYGNVEFVATNLKPATKYYYRIVGENCKGTSLGAIEWLMTARGNLHSVGGTVGNTTVKNTTSTTVVKNTTITDTSIKAIGAGTSYLRLDVTNDNDIPDGNEPIHTVIRGEVVVYRVVWENLTTSLLHDGKIRVNLPKALSFMNSSNGIYDKDSHSVYMTIGDIAGRASGVEFITVQVTTSGEIGDPVIVEAIAAFDAPGSDAQVNATDFDEDILGDRAVAVAATPYFGSWMWFVGVGLLLILVFLIARYHTLASQYRGGYMPPHPGYQPVYTPPPAPRPAAPPEIDPFVPPASLPRDEGGPVYKPYNPN